jgi:hypothetical protein
MTDATVRPAGVEASDAELNRVAVLARDWLRTKALMQRMQDRLDKVAARHKQISEVLLPDAMMAVGLSELRTLDGFVVAVKEVVNATWPPENRPDRRDAATAYLASLGATDLIQAEVIASFSRAEVEAARQVYESLQSNDKAAVKLVERVHPQTLAAWVRARLKAGEAVDFDVLNVTSINRATVK